MATKRKYDLSFKEQAVKLSYERESVKALDAQLGVSSERLYKWRAEYGEHGEASFNFWFSSFAPRPFKQV